MRHIIIGDIHGCYHTLKAMIDKLKIKEDDILIFTGDYTDRGEYSYEVYLYLKDLKEKMGDRLVLILGNHEEFIAEKEYRLWERNGGCATQLSFKNNNLDIDEYIKFINVNTVRFYKSKKFQVCHAGITNAYGDHIEKERSDVLVWDRDAVRYGMYNGKLTIVGHTPIEKPLLHNYDGHKTYGYRSKYDLPEKGVLCIDTACVFGNILTAVIIEDNKMRFVKVPYIS